MGTEPGRDPAVTRRPRVSRGLRNAAVDLLDCYAALAREGSHLLAPILAGGPPRQWEHYPTDDAFDRERRYQWYYHSHDPEDRKGSAEHGHFHLFARAEGIAGEMDQARERRFLSRLRAGPRRVKTYHLLAIGMNALGVPLSLFTVNRWVTGDSLLSGGATCALLRDLRLSTEHPRIDSVLTSVLRLHEMEVCALIDERDRALLVRAARGPGALDDRKLEVTSFIALDVDSRLRQSTDQRAKTGGARAVAGFRRTTQQRPRIRRR